MDKGAHFYRCDFQVHSPRDTNWVGPRPTSEEERMAYAERFIKACRKKGLGAVAITDHHDLVFFRHIKAAAQNEVDDLGNVIPENERMVIFPGMELTLGVPCQALLILDATFPVELLPTLNTILSVSSNDPTEPCHAAVKRLDHIKSFTSLCELLDRTEYLRGHYIVLPNISEGGSSTILRSGFCGAYKDMPCVGGYLDGPLEQLGNGNREILEGRNKDYGFKAIGIFQTSDNRRDDFQDLGIHSSWVKWAIPTAEALRQACLARKTRISNLEPHIPSLIIQSLEVSNSKFMGPASIEFNPQLNCFIGGRGTGKSTVLEYLRWALCDQLPAVRAEGEVPDFQVKRSSLIENTLIPLEAVVTVVFLLNKVPHVVRRIARTNQLLLKIGKGEFEDRGEADIRRLLSIQAYSQKQLSAVSVRQDELKRLIRAPVEQELSNLQSEEGELKASLRSSYGRIHSKRLLSKQIEGERLELDSLTRQAETLRSGLQGLSDSDRDIIAKHSVLLEEEGRIKSYGLSIRSLQEILHSAKQEIALIPRSKDLMDNLPNLELLKKVQDQYLTILKMADEQIEKVENLFSEKSDPIKRFNELCSAWEATFTLHNKEYEAAKARATSHESKLKEISLVEKRISTLSKSISEKTRQLTGLGTPEREYENARAAWSQIYSRRADLLEAKCRELTVLSENRIRATLRRGAGLGRVYELFERMIGGTRIRIKKVEDLCEYIAASVNPVLEWERVLVEFESLAQLELSETQEAELPPTPLLAKTGLAYVDLQKIAHKLTIDEWLELSLAELEDVPIFEYQQREGEYIKFSDASAGQQATALLKVLLKQDGPPLIIDQPEEDLDNQVILNIVEDVWSAKGKRQVIFASHNANIVVNGDGDLVIVCDYRTAGDHSGGRIKCQGAIDIDEIRNEITTIMEGGKEAFKLRKQKYGF